jgi:hypothetical protein
MRNKDKYDEVCDKAIAQLDPKMAMFMTNIVAAAADFWERADNLDDFCIQSTDFCEQIVFGGTNRMVWSIRRGFFIDESYCSDKFLRANKDYRRE